MSDKYVLRGKTPVKCDDLLEWAQEFEKGDKRHVAETWVKEKEIRVSTVFLGLDHSFGDGPPLLFETMIFGGPRDGYQDRYPTWGEAEKGHAIAVGLATTAEALQPNERDDKDGA